MPVGRELEHYMRRLPDKAIEVPREGPAKRLVDYRRIQVSGGVLAGLIRVNPIRKVAVDKVELGTLVPGSPLVEICVEAFKRLAAGYSADEKAKLFSGTAKRVYRLA
jgi:hypothetical protein